MADITITVREGSAPGDLTFVLKDRRNEVDPLAEVDITGYAFKFIVKPTVDSDDDEAFFDLSGSIVTAADGEYKFTLNATHTFFLPGTYPGEIRWWSGGAPSTAEPPTDSLSVDYVVEPKIRQNEP